MKLVGITLLPLGIAAVVLLAVVSGEFHPYSDMALAELRTRDIGKAPVLLGPWSRDDWFHPGPLLFYLLAVPYWLTAKASIGIYIGALAINAAALTGMALIARRLGGKPLFFTTLVGCGVLIHSLGIDLLRDPWNPHVTVLPFGLMVFLAWAMACREAWALPVGAAVASFLVQTHIGYILLAGPMLAWGAVWVLAPLWRDRQSQPERRMGLVAAGVLAALWAPPLLQELSQTPGNLTQIAQYFQSKQEQGHTLVDGIRVMAAQFSLAPEWIVGQKPWTVTFEPTALYATPLPLLLFPCVAGAVVLWQRGSDQARRLVLTLGLALVCGLVTVARTTGVMFAYRLAWTQVLAALVASAAAWGAWLLVLTSPAPKLRRLVGHIPTNRRNFGMAAVVGVLAAVNCFSAVRTGAPEEDRVSNGPGKPSDAIADLTPRILDSLPAGDGPVVVQSSSFGAEQYLFSFLLSLERAGVQAQVQPYQIQVGSNRHQNYGNRLRDYLVVGVNRDIEILASDPNMEHIASWGTIPSQRTPDDISLQVEQSWNEVWMPQLRSLARTHLDKAGVVEPAYAIHAVAIFRARGA